MIFWLDRNNNIYDGNVNLTATSTYEPMPNQNLIDELDKKHRKVEKIAKNIFLKGFYNKKALERLCRIYAFLWWKEISF
jgi:hypothetical protein